MVHTSRANPVVSRGQNLTAIYLPPFIEAPDSVMRSRLQVVVGDAANAMVRLIPPAIPSALDEPPLGDRVVLALEPQLFDRRIITGSPQESCDPFLYHMGHALLCGFRAGRVPPESYLTSLVGGIVQHLRHDYPLGRRRRERKGLSQSRLARAVALIDERLAEPLPVNEIASAVHLSAFHFARMFRRSTDCSPHEYLTRRRLERARQLLAGSDLSMLQIAHTVGYRTQAHFTRVFHEGTGTTPRRYRLAHRVGAQR